MPDAGYVFPKWDIESSKLRVISDHAKIRSFIGPTTDHDGELRVLRQHDSDGVVGEEDGKWIVHKVTKDHGENVYA